MQKLKMIGLAAVLSLPCGAFAQQAAEQGKAPATKTEAASASQWGSIRTWFQHFKEGLESSSVTRYERRNVNLTAVAAVRGAQQKLDDPQKPYIKGKMDAKREAQLKKQRAELSSAVDLVLAGKLDEGSAKLDAFEAAYPKSPYIADVRKARDQIKALKSAPPADPAAAVTPAASQAMPAPASDTQSKP